MQVLDKGYCKIVGHWGSDEDIISAARMSTNKGFQGWYRKCSCVQDTPSESPTLCEECKGKGYIPGDEKLLRYLWEHKHTSPFEMAGLTIEAQTPVFVAREWFRHRTQSYSELSARYTALPDLYYIPSIERLMGGKQAIKNKQGSEGGFTEVEALEFQNVLESASLSARLQYESLLAAGLSRELARLVIPVNQYTRFRASANLRNWLGFLALRLDTSAQHEIREYAKAVASLVEDLFPKTWGLFAEGLHGRN